MSETRRTFLQKTAAATTGLLMAGTVHALPEFSETAQKTSDRGLLFDQRDLPRIRKTLAHPRFTEFWKTSQEADLGADRKFLRDQLRLNNHVKDFLQARLILERSAFVYAVTGNNDHLEVARLAISRILEYKKWDYFLEGGKETIGLQRAPETTIAMACAYEWLADRLSTNEKEEIVRQIAEKGAPACYRTLYGMKYPDRVRGWGFDPESDYPLRFDLSRWPFILNSTNLKVIPIAGLAIAGCLLYGKHPMAQRWVDLALTSAKAFATMFGPDGSYDEGVGYWGYTALHMTLFAEVLSRKLGIDVKNILNFPGTVRYGLRMSMPTKGRPSDCVNFGDAWSMGDVSVAAWTARERRDRIAQFVATNVGEIRNHFAAIWFNPDLKPERPGQNLFDVRFSNDIVVSRSGWSEQDGVVALRSGGPANHEHADRNSVVFKVFGERFFHDPYKAAYSYTEPHWKLRLTESHTAILIGGKGHQYHDGHEGTNASWAEANVVRYESAQDHMIVTSDATAAYKLVNPDVSLVQRTLVFLKPTAVIIIDRVRLAANPLAVQARFQIDNSDGKGSGEVRNDGFVIFRPTATLRAMCSGSQPVVFRTSRLDVPEQNGIHPFIEAESASGLNHTIVTAAAAEPGSSVPTALIARQEGTLWRINGKLGNKPVDVRVSLGSDLPVITL